MSRYCYSITIVHVAGLFFEAHLYAARSKRMKVGHCRRSGNLDWSGSWNLQSCQHDSPVCLQYRCAIKGGIIFTGGICINVYVSCFVCGKVNINISCHPHVYNTRTVYLKCPSSESLSELEHQGNVGVVVLMTVRDYFVHTMLGKLFNSTFHPRKSP